MRFNGVVDTVYGISAKEGVREFWRGNATNVLRYFPTQALSFEFNDIFQRILCPVSTQKDKQKMLLWSTVAGGLAGGCALIFTFPLDLIRTRLSADLGNSSQRYYSGSFDACRKIVNGEGVLGLYRGVWTSFAMYVPYRGIFFGGFATLKSIFMSKPEQQTLTRRWLISQLVTSFAQTLIYPLDTVRRRLMLAGEAAQNLTKTIETNPSTSSSPTTTTTTTTTTTSKMVYRNTLHCFKSIVREEGVLALYSGVGVNLLRSVGGALCMTFYDTL
eukprot:TRINITY_DN4188_c0_g1_i6.p1 TRINITY_DN4188_c0_g1~~TRINITY_DN4188_c0_g1_i6.p1  ORF type:complete len:273 (-),score=42.86 TRINITY_DN4188_c0_g1_i6:82-900(-)